MLSDQQSPIGIFDSGLGGLTVFRAVEQLMPEESLIYFGDTARVPYGNKSPHTVAQYSQDIVDFLSQKNVKAIVVACNTASAFALPSLIQKYDVPIFGVIEPGARAAVKKSIQGQIAVIGTRGTIQSDSYCQALLKIDANLIISQQACPLFVPLVEEAWLEHSVTDQVIAEYLEDVKKSSVDTLILGCTHYPVLKPSLQSYLGPQITLVDSAEETALHLQEWLLQNDLLCKNKSYENRFFVSDAAEKFSKNAEIFLGYSPRSTQVSL